MDRYEKGNKLLRLPVRFVNGHWEFYFGGSIPVEEGTFAEMLVHPVGINDPKFLERVTKPASVCVAKPGETLLIALNARVSCTSGRPHWTGKGSPANAVDVDVADLPCERPTFVPVTLLQATREPGKPPPDPMKSGLWLRVIGTNQAELLSGPIDLPEEFAERDGEATIAARAISLNHAYTKLSERLETHRISHTGNVYTQVFYEESDKRWYQLENLRNKVIAHAELKIIKDAWAALEKELGWSVTPFAGTKGRDRLQKGNRE